MLKLTFIDTESAWDEYLHEDYRAIDAAGVAKLERQGRKRHNQACKRIFAAAALDLVINDDRTMAIEGLTAWTEREYGDEQAVVEGLLDHIRYRPDHRIVSYGGLAAELPLLTLCAMEHGMLLPEQLRSNQRVRFGEMRPHMDLALELKGQGRDWAHLSEIGLRMGMPRELFVGKTEVELPRTAEDWIDVRRHVSCDVVLTAMVTLAWLRVQGRISIDMPAAIYNLADWFLRRTGDETRMAEPLAELRMRMAEQMTAEFDLAA
ncbi:3'-5' exonuclease [Qipengyuania flava]|uniref:3'-5' exonuclease n=1 Tax=Qipengyuania flava TaxID=192812 RepID=UPI001CD4663B|nr:3'-5' exonuclease [Qipengyuania flava]MCA0890481.1 3'-5' exonuclease [Qipengyuania flava]